MKLIEWITHELSAKGELGISPPEILKSAEAAGLKIHPNSPYVALKSLVTRKLAFKKDGRYYDPATQKAHS